MNGVKLGFWILLDVFIAILIVGIAMWGVPAISHYGDSLAPARTVTATAQGKTTATPDLAELTFSVVTQGQNPQTLSDNNNMQMNSVMRFLANQGIASSDIQTVSYDLQPNYQYPQNGVQGVINGYTLTQSVQVKIHDLTKTASVIGGLAPLGVNQIGSIDFTFSNDAQVQTLAAARANALANAKQEAEQMAQAAGGSLGAVVNVNESNYIPVPVRMYSAAAGMGGMNSAASTPSIQPGSQDITDTVTVTYALR